MKKSREKQRTEGGKGEEQQTAKLLPKVVWAQRSERTGALVVPRAGAPCCCCCSTLQSSHPPHSLSLRVGVGVLARAKMEFEMEKCFTFCGTGSIERDYF